MVELRSSLKEQQDFHSSRRHMDDQSNRLHVDLRNPHCGWVEIAISTLDQSFEAAISYTPNDFILELATALSLVMQGGDGIAIASSEPVTYELMFSSLAAPKTSQFQIVKYSDWNRTRKSACVVFSFQSTQLDIVLPFWCSLRSLQRRFSATEYSERMGREFPLYCFQRLSHLVFQS